MPEIDVVIAGGGSAGVAAAIGAARAGASVLLVERGPALGGAATMRNVVTYCGLFTLEGEQVVDGVAGEVLDALAARGAVSEPRRFTAVSVVFDPEELKVVLDRLVLDSGADVRLHSMVVGAEGTADEIRAIRVATHGGAADIAARAFVDASGDADLAELASAAVRYGNDGIVQSGSLGVRFGGIPTDVDIDRARLHAALGELTTGDSVRFGHSSLVARMPISNDIVTYLVDAAYDARSAQEVSRAEASARRLSQLALTALRTLPGCSAAYIVSTGPELGTRESRHVVTRSQLVAADLQTPTPRHDTVALGAWPMEYHPGPGLATEWSFIGDPGYYGIPLDCLRSSSHDNLFVAGRALDGDRMAGSSVRAMGTAFATGQAAGVAAALRATGIDPTPQLVQRELRRQGVTLGQDEVLSA